MTNAHAMLETYPRSFNVDQELLAKAIDAIVECGNTCTQCADACLSEAALSPELAKCVRLNLDCADVCEATSRVISRQTEYDAEITRLLLQACAAACHSCGDECATHAEHMQHCRICAESCRRCEDACRELLVGMG